MDLASFLRTAGPLPPAQAVRLIGALCQTLSAEGTDGGAARQRGALDPALIEVGDGGEGPVRVRGVTLRDGKPDEGAAPYTAPDAAKPDEAGEAADVYAVSALLYHALTGQPPFRGATPAAVRVQHMLERPRAPRALRPEIPAALEEAVLAGLRKSPTARPQTLARFHEDLQAALRASPAAVLSPAPAPAPAFGAMPAPMPAPAPMMMPGGGPPAPMAAAPVAAAPPAPMPGALIGGGTLMSQAPIAAPARRPRWWLLGGAAAALGLLAVILFSLSGQDRRAPRSEVARAPAPTAPAAAGKEDAPAAPAPAPEEAARPGASAQAEEAKAPAPAKAPRPKAAPPRPAKAAPASPPRSRKAMVDEGAFDEQRADRTERERTSKTKSKKRGKRIAPAETARKAAEPVAPPPPPVLRPPPPPTPAMEAPPPVAATPDRTRPLLLAGSAVVAALALLAIVLLWRQLRRSQKEAEAAALRAAQPTLTSPGPLTDTVIMTSPPDMIGQARAAPPPPPRPADDDLEPFLVGQYRCFARLGEGGMGMVYKAQHVTLERLSAVKVLLPQAAISDDAVHLFRREAKLASSINHPHSVFIYDYGEIGEQLFYLAMEYIQGRSLDEVIEPEGQPPRPLPLPRVLHIARQICGALEAAHQAGVIHRDLKPQNVMICQRPGDPDHVKVVDFGIARSLTQQSTFHTMAGAVMGTPAYMSPEQALGDSDLDARTDIYSLGLLVYRMLAGDLPFRREGMTPVQQIVERALLKAAPPPIRQLRPDLGIPQGIEAALLHALEPDRQRRTPSAMAFLHELEAAA